ncbi:MAG: carboxyl transferase domain-containing protein, partial [[Clostridium] symbiosum]
MPVVGPESAVDSCCTSELKRAEENGDDTAALRTQLIEDYTKEYMNPYKAAECGKFEDIIEPAQSRQVIIRTLEMFRNKKVVLPSRKHGNIPL